MKGEFFLEMGPEEIPAGFIGPATGSLSDLFTRALRSAVWRMVESRPTRRQGDLS